MRALAVFLILGLGLPAAPALARSKRQSKASRIQEYLKFASKLFKAGDFEGALVQLQRAEPMLEGHKKQALVRFNIARCFEELGRHAEALGAYERFLEDPDTLALARPCLRVFGVAVTGDVVGMTLLSALLGAGASRTVMVVSTGLQWGFFLPLAWLVGPVLGYGLLGIWVLQGVYRVLQSVVFAWIWHRRRWTTVTL